LLLAATVRSFAHMPLGISDRNKYQAKIMHLPTKSELSPTLTFFMDEMRIHTKRPMTTSTALKNCGVHKLCTYLYQKTPF